jgi:hypothetical protein
MLPTVHILHTTATFGIINECFQSSLHAIIVQDTHENAMAMQWWPGVVDTPVREADNQISRGEEGQIVYHVNYEAFDEFAAERCQVCFLTERAVSPHSNASLVGFLAGALILQHHLLALLIHTYIELDKTYHIQTGMLRTMWMRI